MASVATIGVVAAGGAAACAFGALEVSHCLGKLKKADGNDVQVSSDATAEYIGQVRCSVRGSYFSSKKHVTLLGDVVVLSRRLGNADAMVSLRGADVDADGTVVTAVSAEGAPLMKFRLASADEAKEWSETLMCAAQSSMAVPRMLSLTRVQLEQLKGGRNGGFSNDQIAELEAGLVERESELERLRKDLDGFKDVPNMLSLDQRQAGELDEICKAKEERIAQLEAELAGEVAPPGMVTLTQKQVEELEARASEKEGRVAALEEQLAGMAALPRQLSLTRHQVADMEAKAAEKEREASELQAKLDGLQEVPRQLSLKRREVQQLEAHALEKEQKIAELQGQLQGLGTVSKLPTLTQKQLQDLTEKTAAKERELEELKQHFAAELSKRPVRYVGVPVVQPRYVGGPPMAVPVAHQGRTRWGQQIAVVRQRLPGSPVAFGSGSPTGR